MGPNGVQGLQQVVLYSLPELDGAVEAVVLRARGRGQHHHRRGVRRLLARLKAKVRLRKKQAAERELAFICYGFPPNVGAVGTAALLNVERSLENVLLALHEGGYDLGPVLPAPGSAGAGAGAGVSKRLGGGELDGTDIVAALKLLARDDLTAGGVRRAQQTLEQSGFRGLTVVGRSVSSTELKGWLGKRMASKMEAQWGDLAGFSEIGYLVRGNSPCLACNLEGIHGVQPVLGIRGPHAHAVRERPHATPQYAAFTSGSARRASQTHCPLRNARHGGVAAWLPLGNTADSWPDVLLGAPRTCICIRATTRQRVSWPSGGVTQW